jgi:NAD(P)-dependent dehydrogenase (short-subunit alcohol dehydrogenase family)
MGQGASSPAPWDESSVPDPFSLVGRNANDTVTARKAIVTGANTGLGLETARALAERGCDVVMGCRSREKGEAAAALINGSDMVSESGGQARFAPLDLGDLDSVRAFAAEMHSAAEVGRGPIDVLVLNAGVMVPPQGKTKQGLELQFGVNHVGHFALTGLLWDLMRRPSEAEGANNSDTSEGGVAGRSRIVIVSSSAHHGAKAVDFDDLNGENKYYQQGWPQYSLSKLCNLLFMRELVRRTAGDETAPVVAAAHPGWTATELQRTSVLAQIGNRFIAMSVRQGAQPQIRAAIDPQVRPGDYFGPGGFTELRGPPVLVETSSYAKNDDWALQLWTATETLAGVTFEPASTVVSE